MSKEKKAQGEIGFILYNPFTETHWFRVYDPDSNSRKYKDYRIAAEDIKVQILSGGLSLYQEDEPGKSRLDWSTRSHGGPMEDDK